VWRIENGKLRVERGHLGLLRLTSTYFDSAQYETLGERNLEFRIESGELAPRPTSTYFDLLRLRSVRDAQYGALSTGRSVNGH
jgi:hypothetical protein